jgi:hypothetical protein
VAGEGDIEASLRAPQPKQRQTARSRSGDMARGRTRHTENRDRPCPDILDDVIKIWDFC